ncbi:MAG: hypothetical protein JNN20_10710 [Betaproteobacteria bacterium]|nr:hypothetical protein [Betaproteobacteria bacterium]
MQTVASQRLLSMSLPADALVAERGDAVQLHLRRNGLKVVVTVPKSVREWFVEATDATTGARTEDWCDYDGYDSTAPERLEQDMAEEVTLFVQRLLGSDLRFEVKGHAKLLWKLSGTWQQAVPLAASAV